ncbi:MAG: hypothetical protein IT210_08205 [Armatimonadetes bacterium]|nr:hypothetical protein [Armatimonadota bacterium]
MLLDIAPFALPNCEPGEMRFEDVRDIRQVVVHFAGAAPKEFILEYLQKTWPGVRTERYRPMTEPGSFGWVAIDDWFNSKWKEAAVEIQKTGDRSATVTFQRLTGEFPDCGDYDVAFRRTLGIRVKSPAPVEKFEVYTVSGVKTARIRVELDAGAKTPARSVRLSAHNAVINSVSPEAGTGADGLFLSLPAEGKRAFGLDVSYLDASVLYPNDDGQITFAMDEETFTISLNALEKEGPIWFADQSVYINSDRDNTSFDGYRARNEGKKTVGQQVLGRNEQTYGGAFRGQPRPHAVPYILGGYHTRQRFWIDPNGDIFREQSDVRWVPARDTPRYKNDGSSRIYFRLDRWCPTGRFNDPAPVLAYNVHLKNGDIMLDQKSFAVPLLHSLLDGEKESDEPMAALVRFRFRNAGDREAVARLPLEYSPQTDRWHQRAGGHGNGNEVPDGPLEKLSASDGRVFGQWHDEKVLRCAYESTMDPSETRTGLEFVRALKPGESCELVLKVPYIALESAEEMAALAKLDFITGHRQVTEFWRKLAAKGATIRTPEPHLNSLHAHQVSIINSADFAMPGDNYLVNTSVGTSTYGNFSNEACMILQELDHRGLHEEVRRRLQVWIKYQNTARLRGNFSDYDGMYYGAGGYESGDSYCQHHGWVLWYLSEHYLLTGDDKWFAGVVDSMSQAADWIFRQRRNTMEKLPHSRGWEYGFLPAGALEDVDDYYYWLSTNSLTWRGTESFARALEMSKHPQAARIRQEADAYGQDLRKGFDNMRRHTPLVRLRDGRWVPYYPSRLYRRGRDVGWIREVLEGSVYLLISGLYDPNGKEAQWILDDYQDNRYMTQPYSYIVPDPPGNWFDDGGFSMQPNLLAGLMPYLDRDEPELYIWMFFNAWVSCYREETNAMVEHPLPALGYSNSVPFKTSDQSNAAAWLGYMFAYTLKDTLHLGRALPRYWFADGGDIGIERASTCYGDVSIRYRSAVSGGKITADADLALRKDPARALIRFRHPDKFLIKSVLINGQPHAAFDPIKGDVDVTGMKGKVAVEVRY